MAEEGLACGSGGGKTRRRDERRNEREGNSGFLPVVWLACGSVGEETRRRNGVRDERRKFGIPDGRLGARLHLGGEPQRRDGKRRTQMLP